jgi:hypothetical protein
MGELDGNGHTINIISSAASATGSVTATSSNFGIIGVAGEGASLKNVHIHIPTGVTFGSATASEVGALVGRTGSGVIITNCKVTGGGTVTGFHVVGGLIGQGSGGGKTSDSSSTVNVVATGNDTGGFMGRASSGSLIERSFATGRVNSSGTRVGGFVGDTSASSIDARFSYATGNVTGAGLRVGGFVGNAGSGTISDCYATGNVVGESNGVGGFAGGLGGAIIRSYATGSVQGASSVGGFAGIVTSGNITDCSATGNVTSTTGSASIGTWESGVAGAFLGTVEAVSGNFAATTSFASGRVTSTATTGNVHLGAFVGLVRNMQQTTGGVYYVRTLTLTRCVSATEFITSAAGSTATVGVLGYRGIGNVVVSVYSHYRSELRYNNAPYSTTIGAQLAENTTNGTVTGLNLLTTQTDAQLRTQTPYATWNSTTIWEFTAGQYPVLRPWSVEGNQPAVTRTITTALQLMNIGNPAAPFNYNRHDNYVLGNNINLSDGTIPAGTWAMYTATMATVFQGVLDGNGFTINISGTWRPAASAPEAFGIVGRTSFGSFRNITVNLAAGAIWGHENQDNVGVVVGLMLPPLIFNCSVTGTGTVEGRNQVGGLFGNMAGRSGVVRNCSSTVNVVASGDNVGGLIGHSGDTGVWDSWSSGHVTGRDHVGGFVGQTWTESGGYNRSFATGNVTGRTVVGGFVGHYGWSGNGFLDCYATGNVTSTGSHPDNQNNMGAGVVGGFAGGARIQTGTANMTFMRCYAFGNVTNTATSGFVSIGGFIGMTEVAWTVAGSTISRDLNVNIHNCAVLTQTIRTNPGVTASVGAIMGRRVGSLLFATGTQTFRNSGMVHQVVGGSTTAVTAIAGTEFTPQAGTVVTPVLSNPGLVSGRTLEQFKQDSTWAALNFNFLAVWRMGGMIAGGEVNSGLPVFRYMHPDIAGKVWLQFNTMGGSYVPEVPLEWVYQNTYNAAESTFASPANPTFVGGGWNFAGYYSAQTGGVLQIDTNGAVQSDLIARINSAQNGASVEIFARWTATIHYNILGANGTAVGVSSQTITRGVAHTMPTQTQVQAAYSGWTFVNWSWTTAAAYVANDSASSVPATITTTNMSTFDSRVSNGAITAYARMRTAVNYNTLGGTTIAAGAKYYGVAFTPSTSTTRTGFNALSGWFTTQALAERLPTHAQDQEGRVTTIAQFDMGTNHTLFARWVAPVVWAPTTTMTTANYGQTNYSWTPSTAATCLRATTGNHTITYSIAPGSNLPTGFNLNTTTGAITSTNVPTSIGTSHSITIRATSENGQTRDVAFTLAIADVTPPTQPTITPSTTAWTGDNVTLTVASTDNIALHPTGRFLMTTSATTPLATDPLWQLSNLFTVTGNGTYYIWAKDSSNNISTSRSITISNIQKAAPTWGATPISGNPTNATSIITLTANATSARAELGIRYHWGFTTENPGSMTPQQLSALFAASAVGTVSRTVSANGYFVAWVAHEFGGNVIGAVSEPRWVHVTRYANPDERPTAPTIIFQTLEVSDNSGVTWRSFTGTLTEYESGPYFATTENSGTVRKRWINVESGTWANGLTRLSITHGTHTMYNIHRTEYRLGVGVQPSGAWVTVPANGFVYLRNAQGNFHGIINIEAVTFDARGTDPGNNASVTTATNVRVDNVPPPAPTISPTSTRLDGSLHVVQRAPGNFLTVITLTQVTDDGSGVARIEYRIFEDGVWGNWITYSGAFDLQRTTSKTITIEYRQVDAAGNVGVAASTQFLFDLGNPILGTISNTGTNFGGTIFDTSSLTFTISATDALSGLADVGGVVYSTNGTSWNNAIKSGANWTVTLSTSFTGTLHIKAVDLAGNESAPQLFNIVISNVAPSVSASVPSNWSATTIQTTFTVAGPFNVTHYRISTSSTFADTNWFELGTALSNGQTFTADRGAGTYYVWVRNQFGLVSEAESFQITRIDTTPPVIASVSGYDTWTNQNITLDIVATDSESGIHPVNPFAVTLTSNLGVPIWQSEIIVGENRTYYIWVRDAVGNVSAPFQITVTKIDRKAPDISFTVVNDQQEQNVFFGEEFDFTIMATDTTSSTDAASGIAGVFWSTDNSTWNTATSGGSGVWEFSFSTRGTHTIYLKAIDNAGNITIISQVFEVTNDKPTVEASVNEEGWRTGAQTREVTFTLGGTFVATQYQIHSTLGGFDATDGWLAILDTSNFKLQLGEGTYYIWVRDGGTGLYSSAVMFIVGKFDNTAPTIDNITWNTTWTRDASIQITVNATDNQSGVALYELRDADGIVITAWQASNQFTILENGTYIIAVQDEMGNTTTKVFTVSNFDRTAPIIDGISRNTAWTKDNIVITVTASDDQSGLAAHAFELRAADGETVLAEWQSSNTFTIEDNGTFIVAVRDTVGNIRLSSPIIISNIDRTAPIITSVTPSEDGPATQLFLVVSATDESALAQSAFQLLRVNDGGGTTVTVAWQISNQLLVTANGRYIVEVRDAAGNTATSDEIVIGNLVQSLGMPSASLTLIDADEWALASRRVTFTIADPRLYGYFLTRTPVVGAGAAGHGNAFTLFAGYDIKTTAGTSFSGIERLGEGVWYLYAINVDGNWVRRSITIEKIDEINPQIEIVTKDRDADPMTFTIEITAGGSDITRIRYARTAVAEVIPGPGNTGTVIITDIEPPDPDDWEVYVLSASEILDLQNGLTITISIDIPYDGIWTVIVESASTRSAQDFDTIYGDQQTQVIVMIDGIPRDIFLTDEIRRQIERAEQEYDVLMELFPNAIVFNILELQLARAIFDSKANTLVELESRFDNFSRLVDNRYKDATKAALRKILDDATEEINALQAYSIPELMTTLSLSLTSVINRTQSAMQASFDAWQAIPEQFMFEYVQGRTVQSIELPEGLVWHPRELNKQLTTIGDAQMLEAIWEGVTVTISVVIVKADAVPLRTPTFDNQVIGTRLSHIDLTDWRDENGAWEWKQGSLNIESGTHTYTLIYRPFNGYHFNTIEIDVEITGIESTGNNKGGGGDNTILIVALGFAGLCTLIFVAVLLKKKKPSTGGKK